MMGDKEVKLIDTELLRTNIAQIAKACAKSDKQKALVGRILFMIENMPTVEAQPDNGWISVEDRLPDDKKRYLICTESRMDNIEIVYYQPIGDKFSNYEPFWQGDSCRFTTSVTHWQYLPEPPKEVKNETD